MKYLVIGEPCLDIIHKVNGETAHSYGGILYSLIALSHFAGKEDEIYPIMNLGDDEFDNVINMLNRYQNIKTGGINKVDFPTRKVYLDYSLYNSNHKERFETSTDPTFPLDFKFVGKFLEDADAILINMISGVDLTLGTMKEIRERSNAFIHIDVHNLVMKTNSDGTREHTSQKDWKEWCTNADTVQMNETEISFLTGDERNEYKVAEEILINSEADVKGLIVTRGINGVSGFMKKEKSFGNEKFVDLDKTDLSAIENPNFIDTTGCGDVFAAAFTHRYIRDNDFGKSLHFANRMASYNASLEGVNDLYKLIN